MQKLYVQYGCGLSAPQGWMNFDSSLSVRLQHIPLVGHWLISKLKSRQFPGIVRYGDVVKGLPIPANSCDGIYCSYVLEHLSFSDFRAAITNTYTYLKASGIFRAVLPDLRYLAHQYVHSADPQAGNIFMQEAGLGQIERPRGILAIVRTHFGDSLHRWMWDWDSIHLELRNAGFSKIRRAQYRDCTDPMFFYVESEDRWENALGIECIK